MSENMSIKEFRALIQGKVEKSSYRQMLGYQNRESGKAFEKLVDAACEDYMKQKIAFIEKTPEPMKVIRSLGSGRFEAYFEKQAQPDYKGTLRNGRCVCFDAKHTSGDRIEKSRLSVEQEESLRFHHQMGAVSFILVGFNMMEFYVIPWSVWNEMEKLFRYKHIKHEELMSPTNAQYRVNTINGRAADFMSTVDRLFELS